MALSAPATVLADWLNLRDNILPVLEANGQSDVPLVAALAIGAGTGGGGGGGVVIPPTVTAQGGIAITSSSWVVGTSRVTKIDVRNGNSIPIYLQIHNKAQASLVSGDVPSSGDVKVAIAATPSNRSYIYVDNTVIPRNYGPNTLIALSTTENTYTPPSAPQLALINFNLETIV